MASAVAVVVVAAAVHVTVALVAVDQDDDYLMVVLGLVVYMRIGVVLHADREMGTTNVPYDQILVVVDIAVDENPMENYGAEIGAPMDTPVGETCYV